jgi:hypothetical protein
MSEQNALVSAAGAQATNSNRGLCNKRPDTLTM